MQGEQTAGRHGYRVDKSDPVGKALNKGPTPPTPLIAMNLPLT